MTPAAAFDQIAERYDALWTTTAAGSAQRELVWREIDGLFRPGDRVLDIGCGTGADAAHLSERGISAHAIDCSPAMVETARRRGGFSVEVRRAEDADGIDARFDGVLSNFGALNCVEDLTFLARVVRPGGRVAICTIGRFCAWETFYYACRLQFAKAIRRWRGSAAWSRGLTVRYPTVAQLEATFATDFKLQRWTGVGLFVPPSYVHLPDWLVHFFAQLDRALAGLPILRAMSDHRLLTLVRK